jgi:hypothetical protein
MVVLKPLMVQEVTCYLIEPCEIFSDTLEMETTATILPTMQLTALFRLVTLLLVSELLARSTNVPGRRSAFSTLE